MSWQAYALLCAFFLATSDVCAKKALRQVDEYVVAWGRLIWSIPFIVASLPLTELPPIQKPFWYALAALLPIEITAIILYNKAIKTSPLSITIPFLGLTPLFLIVTAFVILGEQPDKSGLAGIVLVAAGAYTLNVKETRAGLTAPLRAIIRERGSLMMVVVAILYSLTSVLGKICAQNSGPAFFAMIYVLIVPILLYPLIHMYSPPGMLVLAFRNPWFILIGLFYGLMLLCHLNAVVLVEVPYMISLKRSSLLFSILYGKIIFHEKGFYERFAGGVLMLIGILCITVI